MRRGTTFCIVGATGAEVLRLLRFEYNLCG